MLNTVLFDLDNTLVDRDRAFRECVQTEFADPAVQAELLRLDQGGRGERRAVFAFWQEHARKSMNQVLLGRLIASRLAPDRGLLEALRRLSSQFKVGVITNGSGQAQRDKFTAAGLAEVIPPSRLWISGEVGTAKPDPAIFLLACRALEESPANCLFIGDQERDDQAGAMAAAMRVRLVKTVLNGERLNQLMLEEQLR